MGGRSSAPLPPQQRYDMPVGGAPGGPPGMGPPGAMSVHSPMHPQQQPMQALHPMDPRAMHMAQQQQGNLVMQQQQQGTLPMGMPAPYSMPHIPGV